MQLNELFEKYSIETIVDKTNIPKEKLADLKNREWDKFKRAQALGFLNILEREFSTDLSEVKEECKNFFAQQTPQHTSASIDFVESQVAQSSNGGVVSKLIAIVTIAALGYTGWYYYNKQNSSFVMPNDNNTTLATETAEENSTKAEQEESKQEPKKEEPKSQETQTQTEPKATDEQKSENSNQKFDINSNTQEPTKQEQKEQEQTQNEQNNDSNISVQNEQNSSLIANNTQEAQEKSVKAQVESLLNESNKTEDNNETTADPLAVANDTNSSDIYNLDSNTSSEENLTSEDNISNELNQDLATEKLPDSLKLVVNSKRLWLGIYNLDTGKKQSKFVKRFTTLDLTNGKLAIITGHSKFSLVTDNETKKFKNRGKSYLLISKEDGIKELTRKEYKELTKRRAF